MDDSCVVCAETLGWVAYGSCGHREVCSTCIIRLRFICDDCHCCICKSESNIIFVTKALGDYTRMINDFSVFPANPSEGQVGPYWYHESTQAYFDDLDHYKMIKAMCRLSCNVCDKKDEQRNGGMKRIGDFNSIEQLKNHLFHRHRLFMCSLCLEGRKIFISEQKLYNRAQLNQHVKSGDSVIDGSESERGGFMGHPMCEFCQNPFYGDNELYLHMSTEHYTCHMCQRQHPGQYVYYKNYDNLEIHFRQEHFLCEDEACLAKKFIVFATESEIKRHNAMEHGGRISRSKRSALLRIPTSFQFRRNNDQDRCSGGNDNHHPSSLDYQLSLAIQDSLETANAERFRDNSSNTQSFSGHRGTSEIESIVNPFELLATIDSEPSSRYCQVVGQNLQSAALEEASFPPLPMGPSTSHQRSRNVLEGLSGNTMAARLHRQNNVKVLNSSWASPAASHNSISSTRIAYQSRPFSDSGLSSSSSSPSSSQSKPASVNEYVPSNHASSVQARPPKANGLIVSSNFASSSRTSRTPCSTSKAGHSASARSLADTGTSGNSVSNIPPVFATQMDDVTKSSQPLLKVDDVQSANKALVQKVRSALEFNEDKFDAFKVISSEYRRDLIGTGEYLAYVYQFGLSHLVLELARLCPSAQKQKELVEIYNYNMRNGFNENGLSIDSGRFKNKKSSKKGKEKCEDNGICSSGNALLNSSKSGGMNLETNHKHFVAKVEVLSKDGYCPAKGKSKILVGEEANLNLSLEPRSKNDAHSAGGGSKKYVGAGEGGNAPRKKTSKFLRNRLGDTSADAALPDAGNSDAGNSDAGPDESEGKTDGNNDISEVLPVHGVWRNGGGKRLVAMTHRDHKK